MDSEYLDPQQCADILSVKSVHFRAVRTASGFPRANIRIEETFLVEKEEVEGWLDRQKKNAR